MNQILTLTRVQEIDPTLKTKLEKILDASFSLGEAWGGSPLGYHSSIYHQDFTSPSNGEFFSQEWGLDVEFVANATVGEWAVYPQREVTRVILERAEVSKADMNEADKAGGLFLELLVSQKAQFEQQLYLLLTRYKGDAFLIRTLRALESLSPVSMDELEHRWRKTVPEIASRDMRACSGGIVAPPHKQLEFAIQHILVNADLCRYLNDTLALTYQHVIHLEDMTMNAPAKDHKVFIGHGRSELWRQVSEFVQNRLKLGYIEFTSAATAGLTITERLTQMLDEASVAVIVMSGEDETADGKIQARMNVIHEAGLFQGRLGMKKVVLLLEDGCEEFSNIHGLGQIRFTKGKIRECFEDLRHVLEREGII